MAIAKICGIETEYGIHRSNPGDNPVTSASLLINAYIAGLKRAQWDFQDETPGNDARGFVAGAGTPPEIDVHLVNAVLSNGARYYVDHAHPEMSTPECASPLELVLYDKAGEEIVRRSLALANSYYPGEGQLSVHKNNSDGKGNSYGCHENYLMDRNTPFARIAQQVTAHFVTRIIYTGAGKVGEEVRSGGEAANFQLSQRAEFFEEEIGLETTLKRPIVNTRDEPHADPRRFRRLHVIVGDANLSEVATFLKVGTTALVLALIEEGRLDGAGLLLENPVQALHQVSRDIGLARTVELVDGRYLRPIDIQWELYRFAREYADDGGLEVLGDEDAGKDLLRRWESCLAVLEEDPMQLANVLDWVAKLQAVEGYMQRHGLDWQDPKLKAIDLQYHDIDPAKSLYTRLRMERLVDSEAVAVAVACPPASTRAYFRGMCLTRFPENVASANWDSIVFDLGEGPLRKVPMTDPLKGTALHTENLIGQASSVEDLIERLGA